MIVLMIVLAISGVMLIGIGISLISSAVADVVTHDVYGR
jgi:hypothetical protein